MFIFDPEEPMRVFSVTVETNPNSEQKKSKQDRDPEESRQDNVDIRNVLGRKQPSTLF